MRPSLFAALILLAALAAVPPAARAMERGVDVTVVEADGSYPGTAVVEPDPMQTAWIVRYSTPFGYSGVLSTDPRAGVAFLNAQKRTIDLRGGPRLYGDGRILGPATPLKEPPPAPQAPPSFGLQSPGE